MTKNRVIPIAVMVGVLLVSYVLDKIMAAVKTFISSTLLVPQGYIWLTLLEFLFASMVILLIWLTLARSKRSILVGTVFLVLGLLCLLQSTFYRIDLFSLIPNPYAGLFRYQLQDLPFFQRIFATFLWNVNHGHIFQGLSVPLPFQFFTKASVMITLLGVIKFFQKPKQALPSM